MRSAARTRTALMGIVCVVVAGCGGGGGGAGGSGSPVGAWSGAGLFVCVRGDGTYGSGDHAAEAAKKSGTWATDGTMTDENGKPVVTWKLDGGHLVITVDPPCDASPSGSNYCGPYDLAPDASLSCG